MLAGLMTLTSVFVGAQGFTFYGRYFPPGGGRGPAVINVKVPDFPWLGIREVKAPEDLAKVARRGKKPAIVFLSKYSDDGRKILAHEDYYYFQQKEVQKHLGDFVWYWGYSKSRPGRIITKAHRLRSPSALVALDADGWVIHIEDPVRRPKDVARALDRILYKLSLFEVVERDAPVFRALLKRDDIRTAITYLKDVYKLNAYISQRTHESLKRLSSELEKHGEMRIEEAQRLAKRGYREEAEEILRQVRKAYKPLDVTKLAAKALREIRKKAR